MLPNLSHFSVCVQDYVHECMFLIQGVETKFKGAFYDVLLSVTHVPELSQVQEREDGLLVGAAVTLNHLKHVLNDLVKRLPG